jgi:membrane protein insertase Oxa1/YidC/SpoIIIJ
MSFRYRRSVKLFPGVKLNFGKKSHSWTIGGKAARTTYNPVTKKTTQSYSTPVKGLYWQKQYGSKKPQNDPKEDNKVSDYDYTNMDTKSDTSQSDPSHGFLGFMSGALEMITGIFELLKTLLWLAWQLVKIGIGAMFVYFIVRLIIALL